VFKDTSYLRATAMACLRTGLLMDLNTLDDTGIYRSSPLMGELAAIASFEEALHAEENEARL
jgi:hypothetical protein